MLGSGVMRPVSLTHSRSSQWRRLRHGRYLTRCEAHGVEAVSAADREDVLRLFAPKAAGGGGGNGGP